MIDMIYFSAIIILLAFIVKLFKGKLSIKKLKILTVVIIFITTIPISNLKISAFIFAVTSYLSLSSYLILIFYILIHLGFINNPLLIRIWYNEQQWLPTYIFFVISAIILYPMTAGLTMYDPYRWGYLNTADSTYLLLYIMITIFLCIGYRWNLLFCILISTILIFYMKVMPSFNLWDIIMDPFIACFSIVQLCKKAYNFSCLRLSKGIK